MENAQFTEFTGEPAQNRMMTNVVKPKKSIMPLIILVIVNALGGYFLVVSMGFLWLPILLAAVVINGTVGQQIGEYYGKKEAVLRVLISIFAEYLLSILILVVVTLKTGGGEGIYFELCFDGCSRLDIVDFLFGWGLVFFGFDVIANIATIIACVAGKKVDVI